jgi:hypothetical protein
MMGVSERRVLREKSCGGCRYRVLMTFSSLTLELLTLAIPAGVNKNCILPEKPFREGTCRDLAKVQRLVQQPR